MTDPTRDALYRRIHAIPSLPHHGKGEQCFPITDAVLAVLATPDPAPEPPMTDDCPDMCSRWPGCGHTVTDFDGSATPDPAPTIHPYDPEHPGGAWCANTTGLPSCFHESTPDPAPDPTYAEAQGTNAHWRDMYLSLLNSWTTICDRAGVEGDSAPTEVLAAIRAQGGGLDVETLARALLSDITTLPWDGAPDGLTVPMRRKAKLVAAEYARLRDTPKGPDNG